MADGSGNSKPEMIASQDVSAARTSAESDIEKLPPAPPEKPVPEKSSAPDLAEQVRVIKTHSDEREYQRLLKRGAWLTTSINSATAVFTGLGAAFTGAAAIYAYFAWQEYHRQADAAEEQTRPWIQVSNAQSSFKTGWRDAQGKAIPSLYTIKVEVKNVGNYVSRYTVAFGEMFASYSPDIGSNLCEYDGEKNYDSDTQVMVEYRLLFPGDTARLSLSPVNHLSQDPKGQKITTSLLTTLLKGCVNYQDAKGKIHHTRFTFDLGDASKGIARPPILVEQLSDAD